MQNTRFLSKNLIVSIDGKQVVSDFSLECLPGSVHALMGPNGSGKSSLASAIMGHPFYKIISGSIFLDEQGITDMPVEQRARQGIFLAVQYPYAVPGLTVFSFLKEAYLACTGKECSVEEFEASVRDVLNKVGLPSDFMHRFLNDGFSGGERKRLECAQVLLLRPRLIILDEIDSGLDADGIRLVASALQAARKELSDSTWIVITHYTRLLTYIVPDYVHVMKNGTVVVSGDNALIAQIDAEGYRGICGV